MYRQTRLTKTTLKVNKTYEGETIEKKIARVLNNKEPIKDGAPIIYTERKDGVNPSHNIRTDRWEHAIEITDKISKTFVARRENSIAERAKKGMEAEAKTEDKNTGGESVGGTQ